MEILFFRKLMELKNFFIIKCFFFFGLLLFLFFGKKLLDVKILDVFCGNLRGRLYRELFICFGIYRECIELED